MADTIKAVTNLDIQLLDASHSNAKTVKLDNPMDNITREQVSAAFITPLANGWFLAGNGSTAMYIGDIVINQSIKTTLGGEDFYVTPDSISLRQTGGVATATVTVSGATIQGYNIKNVVNIDPKDIDATISENGLTANLRVGYTVPNGIEFDFILIIQGTEITIHATALS